jgi:hypothetical protein
VNVCMYVCVNACIYTYIYTRAHIIHTSPGAQFRVLNRVARPGQLPSKAPVSSCPVASFGIIAVEPYGSATRENLFSSNKAPQGNGCRRGL